MDVGFPRWLGNQPFPSFNDATVCLALQEVTILLSIWAMEMLAENSQEVSKALLGGLWVEVVAHLMP